MEIVDVYGLLGLQSGENLMGLAVGLAAGVSDEVNASGQPYGKRRLDQRDMRLAFGLSRWGDGWEVALGVGQTETSS